MNECARACNPATRASYVSAIPMERMEDDPGVWTASRYLKSDDTYEAGGASTHNRIHTRLRSTPRLVCTKHVFFIIEPDYYYYETRVLSSGGEWVIKEARS